jgi:2-polyprenyl-3-methyl-5-hydroxy-6-metoxy-1,4-benzoquinol methylase
MALDLGSVQFFWRVTEEYGVPRNPAPDFLPFALDIDPLTGLVIQVRNEEVLSWLDHVYTQQANVGYLQDGHQYAVTYGTDFMDFVLRMAREHAPSAQSVFEVGAGGCWVLRNLASRGFQVSGCDPSPNAVEAAATAGIRLWAETYEDGDWPQADIIIHYDVLEHAVDPVEFVGRHLNHLTPSGLVAFAVPDTTSNLALGDVSMCLHEHLNYFSPESLRQTVALAGLRAVAVERSRVGGVLYCAAVVQGPVDDDRQEVHETLDKGSRFIARASEFVPHVRNFMTEILSRGQLGIYPGIRGFPYLGTIGDLGGIVLVDDDPGLGGSFYDGFPSPVVSFTALKDVPLSGVLIASTTYAGQLTRNISSLALPPSVRVASLSDFALVDRDQPS